MKNKRLIIFDLDGTLTASKTNLTKEVAFAFSKLLLKKDVAIISGCAFQQFEDQFLKPLERFCPVSSGRLRRLFLLPTSGSQMYEWATGWYQVYNNDLTLKEKVNIYNAWESASIDRDFTCRPPHGEIAEDRGSQITFSMCGQEAPLEIKERYDPEAKIRGRIIAAMHKYVFLERFELKTGGTTSIDVTRKGMDKAYGVERLLERLKMRTKDAVFIGDSLFYGGNDVAVKKTGIDCVETTGPENTTEIINGIIGVD